MSNSTPDERGNSIINAVLIALIGMLIVLITSLCHSADAAEAKIRAPKTANSGVGVVIDGTAAKASATVEWIVGSPEAEVFRSADGRRLMIVAKEGYLFIGQKAIDTDQSEDIAAVLIHVLGGGVTPPDPAPAPVPPPSPPAPAPKPDPDPKPRMPTNETARQSYEAAMRINSPDRREQAAKVAEQLRKTQANIKSGQIVVTSRISLVFGLQDLKTRMKTSLGADGSRIWMPWGDWMAKYMSTLYESERLNTAESWVTTLSEIIQGLEAVQ